MVIAKGHFAIIVRTTGSGPATALVTDRLRPAQSNPCRSGHHVPPLEGEGLPVDVGATVDFPQKLVVGRDVIDKGAAEAQGLQQGAHVHLQAALLLHLRSEGLGDAQVLVEDNHVHLWREVGHQFPFTKHPVGTWPCSKLHEPSQQAYEVGTVIIPTLQMRKPRHRGVKQLIHGRADMENQEPCLCMYVYVHACGFIGMYQCVHEHECVYLWKHACLCVCVHIYIYLCGGEF